MTNWKSLKIGDKVTWTWEDFEGKGTEPCVVTKVADDHVIATGLTFDEKLWIDDMTADMFVRR